MLQDKLFAKQFAITDDTELQRIMIHIDVDMFWNVPFIEGEHQICSWLAMLPLSHPVCKSLLKNKPEKDFKT